MGWSAEIVSKNLTNDKLSISVELKNNKLTDQIVRFRLDVTNSQDSNWVRDRVKEKIEFLDALYAYEATINLGEIDLTASPVVDPPEPDQSQIDREAFIGQYNTLTKMKKAIEAGLLKETDTSYTDQLAVVKSLYKLEYIEIVG